MKLLIVACLLSLAACKDLPFRISPYRVEYDLGGHERLEFGYPGLSVKGEYKYRTPSGSKVTVKYIADDNGYRVTDKDIDSDDDDDDDYQPRPVLKRTSLNTPDLPQTVKSKTSLKTNVHTAGISVASNPTPTKYNAPISNLKYNLEYLPYRIDDGEVKFREVQVPLGYFPYKIKDDKVKFKAIDTPVQYAPKEIKDDKVIMKILPKTDTKGNVYARTALAAETPRQYKYITVKDETAEDDTSMYRPYSFRSKYDDDVKYYYHNYEDY